jgi:hypothetical protein
LNKLLLTNNNSVGSDLVGTYERPGLRTAKYLDTATYQMPELRMAKHINLNYDPFVLHSFLVAQL